MIEIRFHGRGGEGSVVASFLLADAAFREGRSVQAYPYFGVERRGAPVTAFCKIAEEHIRVKSQIYEPDHVIVLNPTLLTMVHVAEGLKEGGSILVNTSKSPEEVRGILGGIDARVGTVDASDIAVRHRLGTSAAPIVNTSVLGAFSKFSGIVGIDSLVASVLEHSPAKKESNAEAAKEAYDRVNMGGESR